MCDHPNFEAHVGVHRLASKDTGPIEHYIAEIQIKCSVCDLSFHFKCLDVGMLFDRPTIGVGGTMLNAPIGPGKIEELPTRMSFEIPVSGKKN